MWPVSETVIPSGLHPEIRGSIPLPATSPFFRTNGRLVKRDNIGFASQD